jgi:hypothetical protein
VDDFDRILECVAEAVSEADRAAHVEQATRGVDAMPEAALQDLIAAACARAGFGVYREQPFPSDVGYHVKESARGRCDMALTEGGAALEDPQRVLLEELAKKGTLFAGADEARGAAPEEAVWLEVKVVKQFTYSRGVPGPNRGYGSELMRAVEGDLGKLSRDARIARGALLVLVFSDCEATGVHDLGVAVRGALKAGMTLREPRMRAVRIDDRVGQGSCVLGLVSVLGG